MLKKLVVMALVAASLHVAVAAPAHAQSGILCGNTGFTVEGSEFWEIDAGPMLASDVDPIGGIDVSTADISITCSVQFSQANRSPHSDPDAVSVTSATTSAVAILPATIVPLESPLWHNAFLCTEVDVGGVVSYFDDELGAWSSDPFSAQCHTQPVYGGPPPPDYEEEVRALVGPVVCLLPELEPVCALVAA